MQSDAQAAWLADAYGATRTDTKTGPAYTLDAAHLLDAAMRLDAQGFVLSSLTGLDTGEDVHVVIHLAVVPDSTVALHVPVPYGGSLPSVTSLWPGADWQERETAEMFGVTFEGHPDPRRLFLTDDFEGHPLRKSFLLEEHS